ncbi:MAG: hypothetical protein IIX19_05915 [Alistipes sp.]|nr:hypothetical protein [Alistipes sp.]
MGRTFKYYPSVAFLPSVALGTLLTANSVRCPFEAFSCQDHICNPSYCKFGNW